jgi:hypothetical protein
VTPDTEETYNGEGGGKNVIFAAFETAATHDELADLVWASRALIDDNAEAAPFFTFEAIARNAVWMECLGLYFHHARRILGRSPYPAELDEIESGFCGAGKYTKREGIARGVRVLREQFPQLNIPAEIQP